MLEPGTLWQRLLAQTARAKAQGALLSIPTSSEWISDRGVDFLVRVVGNLRRKDAQRRALSGSDTDSDNPFLPYEEAMFVAELTSNHVALLNKFNVVAHHLLIVTRVFEEQRKLLTVSDFEAMWIGLREIDGLAFYNGGVVAGASQAHKHLQQVPLPLASSGPRLPIEPLLAGCKEKPGRIVGLPFLHAAVRAPAADSIQQRGEQTLELYHACLAAVGLPSEPGAEDQAAPYNLLATRDWLMVVPRRLESYRNVGSLNALAFAGALLVRDREQLARLAAVGPMSVLEHTAGVRA